MKPRINLTDNNKAFIARLFFAVIVAIALFFLFAYSAGASYCSPNAYKQCEGKTLYWYDSCGNQQNAEYCPSGCWDNQCQDYNYSCAYHAYKACVGNYLYWYDSCGNRQDSQYCQNGCQNNQCQEYNNYNYNYNYGNCNYHAYRLCEGNSIYWYDSCGNRQDLYQTCHGNQTCKYGQCVYSAPPQPSPYVARFKVSCYANNLYWYDSNGAINSLYKICADSNACTADTCTGGACANTLKCDGSTCAAGSADYLKYCASDFPILSVSFFARQSTSGQWGESAEIGQNSQIYFKVTVKNNTAQRVNDVLVSAQVPSEVVSVGNVQIDGVLMSRDIVSGVNIGSLAAFTEKTIEFEGKTESFSTSQTEQAIVKAAVGNTTETDAIDIQFNPGQTAALSGTLSSGFWDFLKRWYLWILVGIVLLFLFIVVFRRLSVSA